MTLPIAPLGGEFSLPSLTGPETTTGSTGGSGFGKALADSIDKLAASQNQADTATQQLATGQAQDVSSVVMSVEKASLELQLATQIRNKAVDAYQEIFRMTV
jgi:flagellar hook-basal body complex protein FliE